METPTATSAGRTLFHTFQVDEIYSVTWFLADDSFELSVWIDEDQDSTLCMTRTHQGVSGLAAAGDIARQMVKDWRDAL